MLAQAQPTSADHEVTDPEGDANDQSWPVAGAAGPQLRSAAPSADLRFVDFYDSAKGLVVELAMTRLTPAFDGAVNARENLRTVYAVRWNATDASGASARSLSFEVQESRGAPVYSAQYEVINSDECSALKRCRWSVPVEIVPGEPGRIRWIVSPRLHPGGVDGTIEGPFGYILQSRSEGPIAYSGSVRPLCFGPTMGLTCIPRDESSHRAVLTDRSARGRAFQSASTAAETAHRNEPFRVEDPTGDQYGSKLREDNDLQALTLLETPDEFVLELKLRQVEANPKDIWVNAVLAFDAQRTYQASLRVEGGIRRWSGTAVVSDDSSALPAWEPFEAHLTIHDAQDVLRIVLPRDQMAAIRPGEIPTEISAEVVTFEPATVTPTTTATPAGSLRSPTSARACVESIHDPTCFPRSTRDEVVAPPYQTQHGSDGFNPGRGFRFVDRIRDETWPGPEISFLADRKGFSLRSFDATGFGAGTTRVRLEIDDYPPDLSEQVESATYAVAFEHTHGFSTVGLHVKRGQAPQGFCQPVDPGVFSATPQDPQSLSWKPTDWEYIQLAPSFSERTGYLSLLAPDACFGSRVEDGIEVLRAGAATFATLRTDPTRSPQPHRVDEALRLDPALVQWSAAPIQSKSTPFRIPFGQDNFWDIIGVVSAFGVSVAGFAVYRTHRSSMRRYLRRIDDARLQYEGKPRGFEEALLVIRSNLRQDLMSGHLAEGQYVAVEKRLDEHLNRTRIAGLVDAFGELPYRLLVKLEQLLADGHMSREDYRNFVAMLRDSHLPSGQQARIRSKLGHWVRQDIA